MKIYQYSNSVEQKIDSVFNYFLRKDYLMRFFSEKEQEDIDIESKSDSPYFQVGEIVEIKLEDEEDILILQIPVEIIDNQLIEYSIYFKTVIDKEEDPLDNEDIDFIKKLFQNKIKYQIKFEQKRKRVFYSELAFIDEKVNFWIGLVYLLMGWYYRIEQIPIHRRIKKEIEQL